MKKKKEFPIVTDLSKTYLIPLVKKPSQYDTEPVYCRLVHEGQGLLRTEPLENAEQYETHRFYDKYLQWLLYTKYIHVLEDEL